MKKTKPRRAPIPPEVIDAHPGAREALERTATLMAEILIRLELEGALPPRAEGLPARDANAVRTPPRGVETDGGGRGD